MKNYNENTSAIQQMEENKANLLLHVEFIMQSIKSGDLHVEKGYIDLLKIMQDHLKINIA